MVGRPPADPRSIVVCLLIRAIFGLSYRSVYSLLASSREYRRMCGIDHLPGYNTIQEHASDIAEKYLEGLIRLTSERIMRVQQRTVCSSTCDGTGLSTKRYGRWFDVRTSMRRKKKSFVKLHAHVTTDAEMPFFLSARVTKGYKSDSKQLEHLIRRKSKEIGIGEMPLDSAYLSRRNAQLIANQGARPYIALKENTASALSLGYPAWNVMVHQAWESEEEYQKHYHRRSVVEGVFSAFKERYGRLVVSKIRHNQNMEILCKVVAWNILALVFHSYG